MGRFKPRKGFTLIEMVVVLAVMGLLTAAAIGIFTAGSRIALKASDQFAEQAAAQQIEAWVRREVQYAGGVALYRNAGDAVADGEHSLCCLDGSGLTVDGSSVLVPAGGYTCRLSFSGAGGQTLIASVTITSKRNPASVFQVAQDIPLPNLRYNGAAAGRNITAATGDSGWQEVGFTDFTPPGA